MQRHHSTVSGIVDRLRRRHVLRPPMFLWCFLPGVLAAVLLAPRSWRNGVVAIASLVFYAVGAGPTTVLLLVCMLLNYLIAPVFGWVLFRSPDLSTALVFVQHMVLPDLGGLTDVVAAALTHQRLMILLLASLVFLLPGEPAAVVSACGRGWARSALGGWLLAGWRGR